MKTQRAIGALLLCACACTDGPKTGPSAAGASAGTGGAVGGTGGTGASAGKGGAGGIGGTGAGAGTGGAGGRESVWAHPGPDGPWEHPDLQFELPGWHVLELKNGCTYGLPDATTVLPKLHWEPCRPEVVPADWECQRLVTDFAYGALEGFGKFGGVWADYQGGLMAIGLNGDGYALTGVVDLETGAWRQVFLDTAAALRKPAGCALAAWDIIAGRVLYDSYASDGSHVWGSALAGPVDGPLQNFFRYDQDYVSENFTLVRSGVFKTFNVFHPFDGGPEVPITGNRGYPDTTKGHGDLIAWDTLENSTWGTQIRYWTPETGARTIVEGQDIRVLYGSAATDGERIYWVRAETAPSYDRTHDIRKLELFAAPIANPTPQTAERFTLDQTSYDGAAQYAACGKVVYEQAYPDRPSETAIFDTKTAEKKVLHFRPTPWYGQVTGDLSCDEVMVTGSDSGEQDLMRIKLRSVK